MVSSRKRMSFKPGNAFSSTEDRRSRAHFDWILFAIVYALALFGVYCISIATFNPDKGTDLSLLNYILNSRTASWQAIFCLASPVIIFFVYAIPANAIVLLSLRSAWRDFRWNQMLISLIVWGSLLSIFMIIFTVYHYNFWKIYLLGIPGQVAIFLWFRMFRPIKNKKEK